MVKRKQEEVHSSQNVNDLLQGSIQCFLESYQASTCKGLLGLLRLFLSPQSNDAITHFLYVKLSDLMFTIFIK